MSGCKRCAECCKTITIRVNLDKYSPEDIIEMADYFRQFSAMMHRAGNEMTVLLPRLCNNLIVTNHGEYACKIYDTRPEVCRKFECSKIKKEVKNETVNQ